MKNIRPRALSTGLFLIYRANLAWDKLFFFVVFPRFFEVVLSPYGQTIHILIDSPGEKIERIKKSNSLFRVYFEVYFFFLDGMVFTF